MERPASAPAWVDVLTAAERPDLWLDCERDFGAMWPEYNGHGNLAGFLGVVFDRYADLQVLVVDTRANAVVARGRTIPFRWDGSLDDLPHGFDALGARAVE